MIDLDELRQRFSDCPCGKKHEITLKNLHSARGLLKETGNLLASDGFPKKVLLVSDKNCLAASDGIEDVLKAAGFEITTKIYDNLRVAAITEVERLMALSESLDGIISVGTGSLNDICRLAAARGNKKLAIFATAPSMDGFASNNAPIITGCFKETLTAKQPDVLIADWDILAKSPAELKSAGFGDMLGKYIGIADWRISNLISGEYYCERVAQLTRDGVAKIAALCDRVTANDPEAAGAIFEALLMTGIGMQLAGCSRPASGTEHTMSHDWDCKKLAQGKIPHYHGKDVGIATLIIAKEYHKMIEHEEVFPKKEQVNWENVRAAYGELLWPDVERLNFPNVLDSVEPDALKENWQAIRQIVREEVPTPEELQDIMERAGAAENPEDSDIDSKLYTEALKYHTYMRHRISLIRLRDMLGI